MLQLPYGAPLCSAVPAASRGRGSLTAATCSFLLLASSCRDGQQPHTFRLRPPSRTHGPGTSVSRPRATAETAAPSGHIQHRLSPGQRRLHALSRTEVLCRCCVVTIQAAADPQLHGQPGGVGTAAGTPCPGGRGSEGPVPAGAAAQVPAWLQLFSLCKWYIAGVGVRHGARLDPLLSPPCPSSPPFCCRSSRGVSSHVYILQACSSGHIPSPSSSHQPRTSGRCPRTPGAPRCPPGTEGAEW